MKKKSRKFFCEIPGLVFFDERGKIVNTGYETPMIREEIYDVDWSDLKDSLPHYINDTFDDSGKLMKHYFKHDARTFEGHRKNKKYLEFIIGKGCVARCTFCHRWDKGIRHTPVHILMNRLDELVDKYNVGFIQLICHH